MEILRCIQNNALMSVNRLYLYNTVSSPLSRHGLRCTHALRPLDRDKCTLTVTCTELYTICVNRVSVTLSFEQKSIERIYTY